MKAMYRNMLLLLAILLTLTATAVAQDDSAQPVEILPRYYKLNNVSYEGQGWNNCGPATLTNALTYFGYADNQTRAANYLKPDREDKNVSPWQMVNFVNNQVP